MDFNLEFDLRDLREETFYVHCNTYLKSSEKIIGLPFEKYHDLVEKHKKGDGEAKKILEKIEKNLNGSVIYFKGSLYFGRRSGKREKYDSCENLYVLEVFEIKSDGIIE